MAVGLPFGVQDATAVMRGVYAPILASRHLAAVYPIIEMVLFGLVFPAGTMVVGLARWLLDRVTRKGILCPPFRLYATMGMAALALVLSQEMTKKTPDSIANNQSIAAAIGFVLLLLATRLRPPQRGDIEGSKRPLRSKKSTPCYAALVRLPRGD